MNPTVQEIKKITGKDVKFINADIRDKKALEEKRDYILDNWDDVVIDWE